MTPVFPLSPCITADTPRLLKTAFYRSLECQDIYNKYLEQGRVGRGDFQFFSRIFLAFCAYPPMTIRFNIVYLKMSVSIWEPPRHDPI